MSHPTMGAWIEICLEPVIGNATYGRTPRWVRGLKYRFPTALQLLHQSHPTMGAWIEIFTVFRIILSPP